MECNSCHVQNVEHARFCAKCGALLPVAPPSADDPLVGQVIKNTFRVLQLLGEGGMGRVYLGEQPMGTTTRKVAIKTLHPHLSSDPAVVARFHRECGTVAELEHPNTIQFFDFGQTPDGTLFIAMEFLEGQAVSALLERNGPFPPPRVEKILRQVSGSLNEAHKKGIVHRDLKPDNVFLTNRAGEEDFVKVLDFGIAARSEAADAKREQKLTQQGTIVGTPPYMSPEQFTGKELDLRSDIYSLAVMAYEMLTGKLPFEADTPWEWATKHLTERPYPFEVTAPPSAFIPEHMKRAILRALSKDPKERQQTVTDFVAELGSEKTAAGAGVAAGSGTAQMAAPPAELLQKGGTQLGTPVFTGPAPSHPGSVPHPTANEMVVPVVGVQPAQPTTRQTPKGKGLLYALAGLVGIGVLVGVVVLARGLIRGSNNDDDSSGSLQIGAAGGGVVEVKPIDTAAVQSPDPNSSNTASPGGGAAGTGGAKQVSPPPTKPTTPGTTAKTDGPTGDDACRQAESMSRTNVQGAVQLYHRCRQTGGTRTSITQRTIEQNAGAAAQAAVYNGDCARAHSIANSAASIGAGSRASQVASRCKK